MTYDEYVLRLQAAAAVTSNDAIFINYIPSFISDAENRCYRDLDLLSTVVRDTSATCTANSRNFTLPSIGGRFVVVNGINIVTPVGSTVSNGTRNRVVPVSLDALDYMWPTNTAASATTLPTQFAMVTDQTISFGPPPGAAFSVEVIGTIRPDPLSPTNQTTFLSLYLTDLFFAASMVSVAGYQRDFGSQSDDPKLSQSWEQQYKTALMSAGIEEMRKKFNGPGWQSLSPAPLAATPR